jgi:hypothetical protein
MKNCKEVALSEKYHWKLTVPSPKSSFCVLTGLTVNELAAKPPIFD